MCRSRRELSNAYFLANFGFDTADNEPCKVCPLSAYRSVRYLYDWGAQLAGLITIGLDNSATHAALLGVCSTVRPWCVVVDAETAEAMRRVCDELPLQESSGGGGGYMPYIICADEGSDSQVGL